MLGLVRALARTVLERAWSGARLPVRDNTTSLVRALASIVLERAWSRACLGYNSARACIGQERFLIMHWSRKVLDHALVKKGS